MPPEDGFRLHYMEMPSPTVRPKLAKPDPKNPIASPEAGMRVGAQRDLKLMPENKVLEREIPAQPNSGNGGTEKEEQDFEHPSE